MPKKKTETKRIQWSECHRLRENQLYTFSFLRKVNVFTFIHFSFRRHKIYSLSFLLSRHLSCVLLFLFIISKFAVDLSLHFVQHRKKNQTNLIDPKHWSALKLLNHIKLSGKTKMTDNTFIQSFYRAWFAVMSLINSFCA